MAKGPDMPTKDRMLVLDFLSGALVRAEELNALEARVQAGYLLAFILALDPEGLDRVASLCALADGWSPEWRENSTEVRRAIGRYYEVRSRLSEPSPLQSEKVATIAGDTRDRAPDMASYRRRFDEVADEAHEEAQELEWLDVWLEETNRPVSEFFDLWESPRGND